jgi:hypothetical protein
MRYPPQNRSGVAGLVIPRGRFYLYYPSRRQSHPGLRRLVAIIRRQWADRVATGNTVADPEDR